MKTKEFLIRITLETRGISKTEIGEIMTCQRVCTERAEVGTPQVLDSVSTLALLLEGSIVERDPRIEFCEGL